MRIGIRVSVLVAACALEVSAQAIAGAGAVSGFVLESALDGMPQATVTVSNSALGVRRVAITTDEGAFDVPGLPPPP